MKTHRIVSFHGRRDPLRVRDTNSAGHLNRRSIIGSRVRSQTRTVAEVLQRVSTSQRHGQ